MATDKEQWWTDNHSDEDDLSTAFQEAAAEKVKQENSERIDKIIDALSVISGALTTVLMVQTIRSN